MQSSGLCKYWARFRCTTSAQRHGGRQYRTDARARDGLKIIVKDAYDDQTCHNIEKPCEGQIRTAGLERMVEKIPLEMSKIRSTFSVQNTCRTQHLRPQTIHVTKIGFVWPESHSSLKSFVRFEGLITLRGQDFLNSQLFMSRYKCMNVHEQLSYAPAYDSCSCVTLFANFSNLLIHSLTHSLIQ